MDEHAMKKYIATGLILVLLAFLAVALAPHVNAFFGAIILFVLFSPVFRVLNKKIPKGYSAIIIIILSMVLVLIPASFLISSALGEIGNISTYRNQIIENVDALDELFPQYDLQESIKEQLSTISNFLRNLLVGALQSLTKAIVTLVIMYFLLYYLFINFDKVEEKAVKILPFNRDNSCKLYREFINITHSTVVATGLIAIMQGLLLSLGFLFFGVPGAFFWGLAGAFLSFLPVVGISIIWIPAGLIYLFQGQWFIGIGLLVWGAFLSNVDNLVRPYIQSKMGKLHPLTSVIGIFIGIPFFGLLGVVVGPLILSYFLLMLDMFKQEYVKR